MLWSSLLPPVPSGHGSAGTPCSPCSRVRVGGDSVERHNAIRDAIFLEVRKAGLQPVLEKAKLLRDDAGGLSNRHPADILVKTTPRLKVTDAPRKEWLAIDVGVATPFSRDRLQEASHEEVAAADMAEKKRRFDRTLERCRAVGLGFEPVILEGTGGIERGGQALLVSIAEEQASRSDESSAEIAHRLRTRISIILARAWRKSLKKRVRGEDSAGVAMEGPPGRGPDEME